MGVVVAEKTFAELLVEFRLARRWDRNILAEKADVSYESIRRYEDEGRRPDHGAVWKLGRALGRLTLRPLLEAAGYDPSEVEEPGEYADLSSDERAVLLIFRSVKNEERPGIVKMWRGMAEQTGREPDA